MCRSKHLRLTPVFLEVRSKGSLVVQCGAVDAQLEVRLFGGEGPNGGICRTNNKLPDLGLGVINRIAQARHGRPCPAFSICSDELFIAQSASAAQRKLSIKRLALISD